MNRILNVAVLGWLVVSGCSKIVDDKSILPIARGEAGEVILVMDSTLWKQDLGKSIREVYHASVPGLNQPEPYFQLRRVDPLALNNVLKSARNMIFVVTLESKTKSSRKLRSYFTENSLDLIRQDTSIFTYTQKDEFARGQNVLYLLGENEADLAEKIRANQSNLRGYFNKIETDRLEEKLYKSLQQKGIENRLASEHQFKLDIPFGYEIAIEKEGFIWLRQLDLEIEKNLFFSYQPYNIPDVFEEQGLLKHRNKIARDNIFDIEDTTVYLTTQYIPGVADLITKEVNFKNQYAVETRGLWKLSDNSLGGPFLSYTLVDESLNRLYYIEGYIAAPGKDKRELIREIEVILNTFSIQTTTPES